MPRLLGPSNKSNPTCFSREAGVSFLAGFAVALVLTTLSGDSFSAPSRSTSIEWKTVNYYGNLLRNSTRLSDKQSNTKSDASISPPKKLSHSLSDEASFVWPSQKLGIPERVATERPFFTPALSLPDLLNTLRKSGVELHGYFINVGAGDGCLSLADAKECDEANQLLPLQADIAQDNVRSRNADLYSSLKFEGVLFEPDSVGIEFLKGVYNPVSYRLIEAPLTYSNAIETFEAAQIPKHSDALKFDTDWADCEVIDAILSAGYRPTLVMAEYNILYPPPLRFNLMASPEGLFQWGASAPLNQKVGDQCSLSYLSDMMTKHGYTLIQVDWWDAFYVLSTEVESITGGAPLYDDLTWYLHGYVANIPSDAERIQFLSKSAYAHGLRGKAESWLQAIVNASRTGETLDAKQQLQMRTDFWWLTAQDGYVQVKDTKLANQRNVCHAGCVPQPFTLA